MTPTTAPARIIPAPGPVTPARAHPSALRLVAFVALVAALAGGVAAQPAAAQTVAGGTVYRAFRLDESLAATGASLTLVPIAAEMPLARVVSLELYGAYAIGSIERGDSTLELTGPVNANVRAVWAAAPWARVTLGVSVPTRDAAHDPEEAQVAAILSTDLLGFREVSFGSGGAVTAGVAFAHRLGDWGVGYGGSYRHAAEFEPLADTALTYVPGSQLVLRVAGDRNLGATGKLTLGASYQHFADDEFASNLFRPGPRVRADVAYAFRRGASTWSLFLTDVWRSQSDATLGDAALDTTVAGSQNLLVVGGAGAMTLGSVALQPRADVRMLGREDGVASGWVGSAGLGVPFRLGTFDLLPRAALMLGAIENSAGERPGISGVEVELTVRWGARN